jgi:hypothetical protein
MGLGEMTNKGFVPHEAKKIIGSTYGDIKEQRS